ncbi:MAG TPA: PadR family transcriptional regulator [Solirubrobacteraceae bacterium]|jgi:DNA-binding PadR family transcriptional regulator|nr:PadR family transcriptional regulator [Solirubrobacteraceae bacterium]
MPTPDPELPPVELSATGRVILGLIPFGRRTGYDIKTFVDRTTRYFWAASYGQIYPELKRLEDQGLVRGRPEPTGGRARTAYELTEAGEAALKQWLASDEEQLYELRDEGMLKLFFSDSLPERRIDIVRAMRVREERALAHLRGIEPHAKKGPAGSYLTLQLGIGLTEWTINWCEATERQLAAATEQE